MSNNFLSNPFPVIFATLFCIFCPVLRGAGLTDIFQNNQQIINDNDNDAEKSGDQKTNEVKPIVSGMLRALQVNRINGPGDKLEEYNDIFTTIPLPKIFNNFFEDFLDNDQEFAWMRYYCWQSL